MIFNKEILSSDIFKELESLNQSHSTEIQPLKDLKLNPDYDRYFSLQEAGIIRLYTMRNDDKELVGYCAFYVSPHIHYKDSVQAYQDLLFITPEYRGKGYGVAFIKWVDQQLKFEGVEYVFHGVKVTNDFSPLLKDMGYEHNETIYARRL